ncbi:MAG: TIGR01777 family oxidoreductase [Actinomycetota bacterium]|nr:TIGR01777 family oxidoreductase [Actinomycetota bacterium]
MRVLVTGGSGLIGSALLARLAAEGHDALVLARPGSRPAPVGAPARVPWDPDAGSLDPEALERAGPFDGVVHLAGAGVGDRRWSPAVKEAIRTSRTRSTVLLAEALAAQDAPPAVLVSASAVGVYGDRGDEELTEASFPGRGFLADVCRAWEASTSAAQQAGIRVVLLRTGFVLSRRGGSLGRQLPLFRLGLGGPLGSGRQFRSWITLEDEVRAILHCLAAPGLAGAVNATAPEPVTDAALARALGRALHRPALLPAPAIALRLALGSEMADELVLASQRALPTALLASGFAFLHRDVGSGVAAVLGRR